MTYNDYYSHQYSLEQLQEVWKLLVPIMIFVLIIWLISVAEYFIRAYSIHSISKRLGVANGWLGYIPIARDYQLGAIAGDLEFGKRKIKNTGLWLIIMPIIAGAVMYAVSLAMFVPMNIAIFTLTEVEDAIGFVSAFYTILVIYCFVAVIAQAAISILRGAALHKLYSKYSQKQMPVVYALISLMLPLGETICLFIHRKKQLLEQQGEGNQPALAQVLPREAYDSGTIETFKETVDEKSDAEIDGEN